jgi:hypothetical protein
MDDFIIEIQNLIQNSGQGIKLKNDIYKKFIELKKTKSTYRTKMRKRLQITSVYVKPMEFKTLCNIKYKALQFDKISVMYDTKKLKQIHTYTKDLKTFLTKSKSHTKTKI